MPDPQPPALSPREQSIFGKLAQWLVSLWHRLHHAWARFAEINQYAAWFPVAVAAISAFDAFVVLIPGDLVVALACLSNPRAWRKLALAAGIGSASGAFALYLFIHFLGREGLHQMQASGMAGHLYAASGFFHHWGLFSLALGSLIPGFTWPPVVLAALTSDDWPQVLAWLLLGRIVRFAILAFGVREGWAMFQAVKKEAEVRRTGVRPAAAPGPHDRPSSGPPQAQS
jgi:membrane protein YqaA with SNARE-associated domain